MCRCEDKSAAAFPRFNRIADEDPRQLMALDDQRGQRDRRREALRRGVDHRPHGSLLDPDRADDGRQRAQPMGGVDHIRPGDARKQVLRPTRKADHLMREDRAEDQDLIVFQHGLVDADVYFIRQRRMPARTGDPLDLVLVDNPQRNQRRGIVPRMVEQAHVPVCRLPIRGADANESAQAFLGQRGMRPQRYHEVEPADIVQDLDDHAEQRGQRQRAGMVGDQHQHPLPREPPAQPLCQCLTDFIVHERTGL